MSNEKSLAAISYEQLQKAAYLNYLERVSKGLPGNDAEDWEKARVHMELTINTPKASKRPATTTAPKSAAPRKPARSTTAKVSAQTTTKAKKATKSSPTSGPENLKVLDGLGAKIETRLHEAGVTTLQQLASWTTKDVEAISKQLKLGTRIAREKWVDQAKALVKKIGPTANRTKFTNHLRTMDSSGPG